MENRVACCSASGFHFCRAEVNTIKTIVQPVTIMIEFMRKMPGPKVLNLFAYSTQLSTKFIQLINVKMLTIVGI